MEMDSLNVSINDRIMYNSFFEEKYEIGVRLQDKNTYFPSHYHNYIEIVCQLDGQSTHFIDDKEIILSKGEIIIIHPSQSHRNIACNFDVLNIIISEMFLLNLVIESAFDNTVITLKNVIENSAHTESYTLSANSFDLLLNVHSFYINNQEDSMYYLRLKLLLINFLISFEDTSLAKQKNQLTQIDLITYLQSNIKDASLNEYAKMLNYSTSVLSHKIKEKYNISFIELLKEMRMRIAVNQLISTNKTIDTIMNEIGYNNKTHFYEVFKTKYGMTPNEYKKLYKK